MNKEVTILLKSMTSEQLLELSASIEKQLAEVKFDELTDLRKMKPFCPRCKSSQIKKVGFSKTCSKQSYQCKECGSKFFISCNSLTHATKNLLVPG